LRLSLAEEIAKHTGVWVPTVRRIISGYNPLGLVALETPGKGGRTLVDESTIYRLLHRHGWRKLVPRPRHRQQPTRKSKRLLKKLPSKRPGESLDS